MGATARGDDSSDGGSGVSTITMAGDGSLPCVSLRCHHLRWMEAEVAAAASSAAEVDGLRERCISGSPCGSDGSGGGNANAAEKADWGETTSSSLLERRDSKALRDSEVLRVGARAQVETRLGSSVVRLRAELGVRGQGWGQAG